LTPEHPRIDDIDAFWARRWRCDSAVLRTPGVSIIALELDGYPDLLQIVRRPATTIVGVPPTRLEAMYQLPLPHPLSARRLAAELDLQFARSAFHAGYRFYIDPGTFVPLETSARRLTDAERGAARRLLADCDPAEVAEAEIDAGLPVLFGTWNEGRLAALAGFHANLDRLADVRVIVHPAHRRQGLARQVVSAICAWGLERGYLVQYECSDWNVGSLALAHDLDCWLYAEVEVILPE
jgi:GNAT superfamily N-acetyltransferase